MKQRETRRDREDIARHARCRWCRKRGGGRRASFLTGIAVTRRCKLFHPGYLKAAAERRKKKSSKTLIASNKVSGVLVVDFSVADFDDTGIVCLLLAEKKQLFSSVKC